ncbi:GGDEF domain-containing protein [Desulfotomaculum nigrificans]|uniref:GGDEF domain-containing protein n=1 Tax=Desulfotomaculum nigrificans TaxID=1565 RepID=UPI00146FA183|nr:GGDEF domain-containing protein [Desulfotomaculum nigrificans]
MKRLRLAPWISIPAYQLFGTDKLERLMITWPSVGEHKDYLTGIPNRQAYEQAIELAVKESARQNAGFGLIVLDLDKFKSVNDQYGHLTGDAVLKEFSDRAVKVLRENDFFARYGGEEFVILTPCHDKTFEIGERVRQAVCGVPFNVNRLNIEVTCSFGCAIYPIGGFTAKEVFQKADDALYQAKKNGRNQGCTGD